LGEIGVQALPRSLGEALQAFDEDPFVAAVLGGELKSEFIKYKMAEWEEYNLTISPWEIRKYARLY
jgi:glutamine synthetase